MQKEQVHLAGDEAGRTSVESGDSVPQGEGSVFALADLACAMPWEDKSPISTRLAFKDAVTPELFVELVQALRNWLGTPDDPNAGWRGSGGTHELYACEYCNAKHGDCTQIPHKPSCPIPAARAAVAQALGDKQ